MHDMPYEMVRKATFNHDSRLNTSPPFFVKAAGTATPSFTSRPISDNLAAGQPPLYDEEDIKGVAGTPYGGTLLPSTDLAFRRLHLFFFSRAKSLGAEGQVRWRGVLHAVSVESW